MRFNIIKGICFIVVGMLWACHSDKGVRKIPIDDFFKSRDRAFYRLSPNGKYLSYLKLQGNKQNLVVEDIATGKRAQLTAVAERNITFYTWVSNNELIYYKEMPGDHAKSEIFIANKDGGNNRRLAVNEDNKLRLLSPKLVDQKFLLVLSNQRDSTVSDVYRLNIENGNMTMSERNDKNFTLWIPDSQGRLRMAMASDGVDETFWYRDSESEPFRKILVNNFQVYFEPLAFSKAQPSVIYALSNQGRNHNALVTIDCHTGKEKQVLVYADTASVVDAYYSAKKDAISYVFYETWKKHKHYLDKGAEETYGQIDSLLPGTELRIIAQSDNEDVVVVRTFTDRNPGSYYLYTQANKRLRKLTDINPSINQNELCQMKPIAYKAKDGLIINGYLTLPKNVKPKNLPAVVFPHNGILQRNSWGYNEDVQFLANRGYAVLQPNYRGSTGYGRAFMVAGFKQWGKHIQNDVDDGANWLVEQGIADPKRMAIYGFGFGGQIALNAACRPGNLYRCAASNMGVLNVFSYLKSVPSYYKSYLQMYYELLGNPKTDMEAMRIASPVFHAEKVKVPIFITQSTKDPKINANDAIQFIKELNKLNKPVTYLEQEDGNTAPVRDENRRKVYASLEQFLNVNLSKK